jgi:hypothetical protein
MLRDIWLADLDEVMDIVDTLLVFKQIFHNEEAYGMTQSFEELGSLLMV